MRWYENTIHPHLLCNPITGSTRSTTYTIIYYVLWKILKCSLYNMLFIVGWLCHQFSRALNNIHNNFRIAKLCQPVEGLRSNRILPTTTHPYDDTVYWQQKGCKQRKRTWNWSEKKNRFNDVDNVKVVKWLQHFISVRFYAHSIHVCFFLREISNSISCRVDGYFSALRRSPCLRATEIKTPASYTIFTHS